MTGADAGLRRAVRVRVPASSANLGPGFDSLGLALAWYDEIDVHMSPAAGEAGAVTLTVAGSGASRADDPASNLVVQTLLRTLANAGMPPVDLTVTCRNTIPQGRGLGSSAAAIVSAVTAALALAEPASALDRDRIVDLGAAMEGHADNVAACVYGGFTIAWRGDPNPVAGRWRALRLEPWERLAPVILLPAHEALTSAARAALPATVPHPAAAATAGRSALLVAAMTQRPDLLFWATEDWLHQSFRGAALQETSELVSRLRSDGLPAVFSGSGPSVLVLHDPDRAAAPRIPAGWAVHTVGVDRGGVVVEPIDMAL